jgi:hypothetical protein
MIGVECLVERATAQLLIGLTTTVALIAGSDLFLIAVQNTPNTAVPVSS